MVRFLIGRDLLYVEIAAAVESEQKETKKHKRVSAVRVAGPKGRNHMRDNLTGLKWLELMT